MRKKRHNYFTWKKVRVVVDIVYRQGQSAEIEGRVSICAQEAESDGVPEVVRSSAREVAIQHGIICLLHTPAGVSVVRARLRRRLGGRDVSTTYQHLKHEDGGVTHPAFLIFKIGLCFLQAVRVFRLLLTSECLN